MCSSVPTIAALSFHAATRIVTAGHSPSGQSPSGGSSGSSWISRDQEGEDHEPDHEARDVGEEERDHPAHHRADRRLKLTSPWFGDPDAECHPRKGQHERDRESEPSAAAPMPELRAAGDHPVALLAGERTPGSPSETATKSSIEDTCGVAPPSAASSKRRFQVLAATPPEVVHLPR